MRKITMFAAAVVVLVLIGIETWIAVRTLTPGDIASATVSPLVMMTNAKGLRTPHYDDYLFVFH